MKRQFQLLSILVTSCVLIPDHAVARLGWYPDFDELVGKSDAVVIAEDTGVRDLPERSVLPNIRTVSHGQTTDVAVLGVETTFKVVAVLKGTLAEPTFLLHHYRLPTPSAHGEMTMISGPGLVTFLGDKQRYLLFLNREADGRYAPASGQTDPNCSIRPIGDAFWTFQRGNVFVPVLRSVVFWLALVFVLPVTILVSALVYLKKRKMLNKSVDAYVSPGADAG